MYQKYIQKTREHQSITICQVLAISQKQELELVFEIFWKLVFEIFCKLVFEIFCKLVFEIFCKLVFEDPQHNMIETKMELEHFLKLNERK